MRIEHLVSLIDNCHTLADVGCDHGRLSKLALSRGLCKNLIASDISEKCLAKARKTLAGYDNAAFMVCDGIPQDTYADFIVISGMGGHTIADILSRYDGRATLLLSPQSHAELVRGHLCKSGYRIVYDKCFEDRNKYYDVIKAEYLGGELTMDALHLKYGRYEEKNDALAARLCRMLGKLPPDSEKRRELEEVLKWQK